MADETEAPANDEPAAEPGRGRRKGKRRARAEPARVIEVQPMAPPARMQLRHWLVLLSFLVVVVAPVALVGWYLIARATDQYASSTGFIVRSEDSVSNTSALGGLSSFFGSGGTGSDSDVIYEFIQNRDLVTGIEAQLDLAGHYAAPWRRDPVFALKPDASAEQLLRYWQRMVRVAYDQGTGLINIEVRAFTPEMAQAIAREIVTESQRVVNELNATARADALSYAGADLAEAQARLKAAREALVKFRTRTQIVDPASDLQGRMGVLNGLQAQLADALVDYDLLLQEAPDNDPRLTQLGHRIDVIRDRIADERAKLASGETAGGLDAYPELLAEYESLSSDREFAEEGYRAARAALDLAQANATRQSRYLATYLRPTLPQEAQYPRRLAIWGLTAAFLFMGWAIATLAVYSLRDRR